MSRRGTSQFRDTLRQYAAGIAQDTASAIADFIAPRVPVGIATGMFKKFSDKNSFQIYDTARALGGPANRIKFEATDGTFNCEPQALEIPIDDAERDKSGDAQDGLEEAKARTVVISGGLARENKVLSVVKDSIAPVSGLGVWSDAAKDPIAEIDQILYDIAIATGMMPNALVLGLGAWRIVKNHAKVLARRPGADNAAVDLGQFAAMLLNPQIEIKVGILSKDTNKWGKGKEAVNIVGGEVFAFLRSANPTQYDPSFAKTFSVGNNSVESVRTYRDEQCRSDILAVDWSEDVQVVAPTCARRISLS